jgi:hypothetical protein
METVKECCNCAKSWPNMDCGHHFKLGGTIVYDSWSETACDNCGDCMFFEETRNRFEIQMDIINSDRPLWYEELNEDVLLEALGLASRLEHEKENGDD